MKILASILLLSGLFAANAQQVGTWKNYTNMKGAVDLSIYDGTIEISKEILPALMFNTVVEC